MQVNILCNATVGKALPIALTLSLLRLNAGVNIPPAATSQYDGANECVQMWLTVLPEMDLRRHAHA